MSHGTARSVSVIASLKNTAQNIQTQGRPFVIANTGAQPLYINPEETATAANGFLIPAGIMPPFKMRVKGDLSVISNATGTSVSVMYFDI